MSTNLKSLRITYLNKARIVTATMAVATIPHPPLHESERLVVLPGKGGPIVKAIVAAEEVGEALGTARIILIRSYQEFPVGGVLIGRWSASADSTQRLIEMLLIFHSNSLGPVACHIPFFKDK